MHAYTHTHIISCLFSIPKSKLHRAGLTQMKAQWIFAEQNQNEWVLK